MVLRLLIRRAPILLLLLFLLSSCDQFSNRYEISKDQKGRTVRLDKRTGEIAIVEDDKILLLKDAKDIEQKQKKATDRLGEFKYWPLLDIPQFKIQAKLTTVWRDGYALYAVELRPFSGKAKGKGFTPIESDKKQEKPAPSINPEPVIRALENRTLFLILEDMPFELANEQLKFSRVVDDSSKPIGMDAKGQLSISKESYEKIDNWNIQWR